MVLPFGYSLDGVGPGLGLTIAISHIHSMQFNLQKSDDIRPQEHALVLSSGGVHDGEAIVLARLRYNQNLS